MEGRRITKLQSCIFGGGFGGGGQTAAVAATEREQGRGSAYLNLLKMSTYRFSSALLLLP